MADNSLMPSLRSCTLTPVRKSTSFVADPAYLLTVLAVGARLKVRAVDLDTGSNGNVTYSVVRSADQTVNRFEVERHTGVVRTADVFDREAQIGVTDYQVTVKAEERSQVKSEKRVWSEPRRLRSVCVKVKVQGHLGATKCDKKRQGQVIK